MRANRLHVLGAETAAKGDVIVYLSAGAIGLALFVYGKLRAAARASIAVACSAAPGRRRRSVNDRQDP